MIFSSMGISRIFCYEHRLFICIFNYYDKDYVAIKRSIIKSENETSLYDIRRE